MITVWSFQRVALVLIVFSQIIIPLNARDNEGLNVSFLM